MHSKQQTILRLLNDSVPRGLSYSQLGEAIGEEVRQKVWYYVAQLQDKDLVRIDPQTKLIYRSQPAADEQTIAIPFYGAANCGPASIFADDYVQGHIKLSKKLIDPDVLPRMQHVIGLEASGDSMNQATVGKDRLPINDGDYVLVDTLEKGLSLHGKYVVSVINGAANIKKGFAKPEQRRIELVSESTGEHPPIILHETDDYLVVGEVKQVIAGA